MNSTETNDSALPTAGGQLTAENRRAEVDGETFVYRRFGKDRTGAPPLCEAQLEAITRWGSPDPSKLAQLTALTQPTFVANVDNDRWMITENSHLLAHHLPSSELRIYADSGHGFLDQYPELFADHVRSFLNGG